MILRGYYGNSVKDTKSFKAEDPERLFLSINRESGRYPEKLVRAMENSTYVVSAWAWLDL